MYVILPPASCTREFASRIAMVKGVLN